MCQLWLRPQLNLAAGTCTPHLQVDADDVSADARRPQGLAGDLQPGARVTAEVQHRRSRPQDVVLGVYLLQLEG